MGYKALVIDDSFVFQKVMTEVLQSIDTVEAVEVAGTGAEGLSKLERGGYDLLFLDMVLPDLGGLDVLERMKSMTGAPPVIVVSGAGATDTGLTVEALEHGALEFINKPSGTGFQESVAILTRDIRRTLHTLDQSRRRAAPDPVERAQSIPVPHPTPPPAPAMARRPKGEGFWITAVAVSTGGPEALTKVIPALPAAYPTPILLVQHMPPHFTTSLARSLDLRSAVRVVEAEAGMNLEPGTVYLAPGGRHMTVALSGGLLTIGLNDDDPECNVRPAADVLFRSLARIPNRRDVLAVIMTGMGEDGRRGVELLKRSGCHCLAQSGESCVVYGMPRAVVDSGLADEIVPLDRLAGRMTALAGRAALKV